MSPDFFNDVASSVLVKTLDAAAARQKTIANNIANIETPGFKRGYVSFEDELNKILKSSDSSEIKENVSKFAPVRQLDNTSPSRPDGNNVNIDAEVADLAKNALLHRSATTLFSLKLSMLRTAINGGR